MNCNRCHLCTEATKQCLPSGSSSPLIYIVGEAPGKEEDEAGVPFIGRSGKYLREMLALEGVPDQFVRMFNIVRCIPRNGAGVRAPSDEEKEACHEYLYADILKHHPRIVLTLGGTSSSYLLKDEFSTITKTRGIFKHGIEISYVWNGSKISDKISVLATFHPSYLIRNGRRPELENLFRGDIAKAMNYAMGRL